MYGGLGGNTGSLNQNQSQNQGSTSKLNNAGVGGGVSLPPIYGGQYGGGMQVPTQARRQSQQPEQTGSTTRLGKVKKGGVGPYGSSVRQQVPIALFAVFLFVCSLCAMCMVMLVLPWYSPCLYRPLH